jgi:hypothetical protein
MPNPDRFPKMDVPVTLTGEEWTAVLARLIRRELSPEGAKIYNRATGKIQDQILAASRRSQMEIVKS